MREIRFRVNLVTQKSAKKKAEEGHQAPPSPSVLGSLRRPARPASAASVRGATHPRERPTTKPERDDEGEADRDDEGRSRRRRRRPTRHEGRGDEEAGGREEPKPGTRRSRPRRGRSPPPPGRRRLRRPSPTRAASGPPARHRDRHDRRPGGRRARADRRSRSAASCSSALHGSHPAARRSSRLLLACPRAESPGSIHGERGNQLRQDAAGANRTGGRGS